MYRFNGVDSRLTRSLELAALLMEGFAGFEHSFRYTMAAHSGDGPWEQLVDASSPPASPRERLDVLAKMVAISQYCSSGDSTVEAAARAVAEAVAGAGLAPGTLDDGAEVCGCERKWTEWRVPNILYCTFHFVQGGGGGNRFVFLLSDANFRRYGINPRDLTKALSSASPHVQSQALFLSSGLDTEADDVLRRMPPRMAHVVMDPGALPQLLRGLLTSQLAVSY
jgi:hypothetical protein